MLAAHHFLPHGRLAGQELGLLETLREHPDQSPDPGGPGLVMGLGGLSRWSFPRVGDRGRHLVGRILGKVVEALGELAQALGQGQSDPTAWAWTSSAISFSFLPGRRSGSPFELVPGGTGVP